MKVPRLFNALLENERTAGMLLVICTIISLVLANSQLHHSYLAIWHHPVAGNDLEYWINDGLMAVFFLMVGLELKREVVCGELSRRDQAMLPALAALGGILVPAGIHMLFNHGTPTHAGAGIPMATDIAFAIGVLSLLGSRVPLPLKVFLTALAVIDDLGAILVIAVFYSTSLHWGYLGGAMAIFLVLLALNKAGVKQLLPFILLGAVMWYLMLHSGVHATIAGVLMAMTIPFGDGSSKSSSGRLLYFLHKPVSFGILPLFALANTGIVLESDWFNHLFTPNGLGISLGLIVGKPVGIALFCAASVALGIAVLPKGVGWRQLIAVGALGGIGFTMSIFITILAFDDPHLVVESKTSILVSSTVAAIIGYFWLGSVLPGRAVDRKAQA
ncbi:MAG TPA: Na+/H+ antiporter NhaA [Flavobacteriales bacterium]|nr:Na+/H+ antiporter NhaA [Flavobacteriales bacterium]